MILADTSSFWWLTWLAIGLVSVLLSALYSGLETGVYCLNPVRLRLHSERGPGPGRWLTGMLMRRERLLVVLLIGNNVSNYGSTAAAAILFAQVDGIDIHQAELFTVLLVTPVLFVVGEMVPKNLFQRFADQLVYRWTWLLRASHVLFRLTGLVTLIGAFTGAIVRIGRRGATSADVFSAREQLHSILRDTAAVGVLSGYQSQIAENVLNVSGVTVADVMTPLRRCAMLPADVTASQFRRFAEKNTYSRWPVYRRGHRHDVYGVVNVQEVLLAEETQWDLESHILQAVDLPLDLPVMHTLVRLQRAHRAMGIVIDSRRRAVGIVTIKDLVEEIVGELAAW